MGHFTLAHLDGDELNPDKIFIELQTKSFHDTTNVINSNSIVVRKEYARVLSHWFKHAAELMDEWYKEK